MMKALMYAILSNCNLFYKALCIWMMIYSYEERNLLYALLSYLLYCTIDVWKNLRKRGQTEDEYIL